MSRSVMMPGPAASGSITTAAPTARRDINCATARRLWPGPTARTVALMPSLTCMAAPFASASPQSTGAALATIGSIYYPDARPSSGARGDRQRLRSSLRRARRRRPASAESFGERRH